MVHIQEGPGKIIAGGHQTGFHHAFGNVQVTGSPDMDGGGGIAAGGGFLGFPRSFHLHRRPGFPGGILHLLIRGFSAGIPGQQKDSRQAQHGDHTGDDQISAHALLLLQPLLAKLRPLFLPSLKIVMVLFHGVPSLPSYFDYPLYSIFRQMARCPITGFADIPGFGQHLPGSGPSGHPGRGISAPFSGSGRIPA